jgi:hypothetical protein
MCKSFLRSILRNEGKQWTEFYEYVKGHKRNRENIEAIKDSNGRLITDSKEKANSLTFYYSSVFSCKHSIPQKQCANSCKPLANSTKIIGKA